MIDLLELKDLSELEKLRDLYRRDWPNNCVGYYCLDNFLKWKKKDVHLKNLRILTSAKEEGLYVIIDRYQLFVGSLNKENCDNLTQALKSLDWSKGFKVSSFLECHRTAVLNTVESKKLNLEYDSLTLMYYLPNAEAKNLDLSCPKGFIIKPLTSAKDAELINSLWPNRHEGSLFLIKRLIDWNINMGIYVETTNELVAWCLRLQGGFLGALQVKEEYKRLGLGAAVTRATSHRIAEDGDDVMALVNKDNIPSRRTFEKLNFKVTEQCYWLRSLPSIENNNWPEDE
ncbi:uncharacterized protein LOC111678380 [Lucilia cuprina]|uniref:uncharacterized protein LOC111678380 n=1 Tax=Lucilia cuprina TaxID=7375 RepID=UPI001F062138|nr:uncharacterized protein LOC111678380 [Lucilia cuprina]